MNATDAGDLLAVMFLFCLVVAGLTWLVERRRKPTIVRNVHMRDWRHRQGEIERLEVRDSYWRAP